MTPQRPRLAPISLRAQIALTLLLLGVLFLVILIVTYTSISTIRSGLYDSFAIADKRSHLAFDLAVITLQCRRYEKDLLLNLDDPVAVERAWTQWQTAYTAMLATLDELERRAERGQGLQEVYAWRQWARQYRDGVTKLHDAILAGVLASPAQGNAILAPQQGAFHELTEAALRLGRREGEVVATIHTQLKASLEQAAALLLGACGLGLLITLAGMLIFPRRLAAPIQALQLAADQLAAGKLEVHVDIKGADELAHLGNSFNHMAETIRQQLQELDQSALIKAQNAQLHSLIEMIQRLDAPMISLYHDVLLVPLIGYLDSQRVRQISQTTLEAIHRNSTRIALIDITGVGAFDVEVAYHMQALSLAGRLLGAQVILTGVGPEAARIITDLGLQLTFYKTVRHLQDGVKYTLDTQPFSQN